MKQFVDSVNMSQEEVNRVSQKIDEMHAQDRFSSNTGQAEPFNPMSSSQTIKEDLDPNEGSYMSNEQRERAMKGTLKFDEINNLPTIPEYEGMQKEYLRGYDAKQNSDHLEGSQTKSIDFEALKEELLRSTEVPPPNKANQDTSN